ncbi:MAG: hypothetical protein MI755_01500 [Sphingomonadales bacterium]|nr:hypothetical protein [Sphingomonadales bacterium]
MATHESDLVVPALTVIARFRDGVSVSELAPLIRLTIRPDAEDREPLASGRGDRLSQKIRNLVSHRTLERQGLARFVSGAPAGRFFITKKGEAMVALVDGSPQRRFRPAPEPPVDAGLFA